MEEYVDSLSSADAAWALERLDGEERREVLAAMAPEAAAAILNVLPSADRADLIAELEDPQAAALLAAMNPAEAREARFRGLP